VVVEELASCGCCLLLRSNFGMTTTTHKLHVSKHTTMKIEVIDIDCECILKLRDLIMIFRLHHSGITMKYHHQLSGLRAPTYMSPPWPFNRAGDKVWSSAKVSAHSFDGICLQRCMLTSSFLTPCIVTLIH
jgi:hypothetical protein